MGRNFIFGDLHGNVSGEEVFLYFKKFPKSRELTKEDVVFQLGDFGYIWRYPEFQLKYKKEQKQLDNLSKLNFTILVIPGNHENYDLIYKLPLINKWGGLVYEYTSISNNKIYFAKKGEVYFINGKKIFTFGGAKTIKSTRTLVSYEMYKNKEIIKKVNSLSGRIRRKKASLSDICYWPQEDPSMEDIINAKKNLKKHNYKFDYILTHTAPYEIIEVMLTESKDKYFNKITVCDTAAFLSTIKDKIDFDIWAFGHLHENIEKKIDSRRYICHYYQEPIELD